MLMSIAYGKDIIAIRTTSQLTMSGFLVGEYISVRSPKESYTLKGCKQPPRKVMPHQTLLYYTVKPFFINVYV
jgi:hypothetical protein